MSVCFFQSLSVCLFYLFISLSIYTGIKKANNSSRTIRNLTNNKNCNIHIESRTGVYKIPFKKICVNLFVVWKNKFMNNLGIKKKKKRNIKNGLVKHNLETNHNFNFKDSNSLAYLHNEKTPENF